MQNSMQKLPILLAYTNRYRLTLVHMRSTRPSRRLCNSTLRVLLSNCCFLWIIKKSTRTFNANQIRSDLTVNFFESRQTSWIASI